MKELEIVLDFQTKQITIDEIILPMTINSLAKSKLTKAWAVNNSMSNEPTSTVKATEQGIHILDAKIGITLMQIPFFGSGEKTPEH